MKRNNDTKKYQRKLNPNRTSYLSLDGRYYCYDIWDASGKTKTTLKLKIGKDGLTEELALFLDESDRYTDLIDRYEEELRDPLFDAKVASYYEYPENEEADNPWEMLSDRSRSFEDTLFAEEIPEYPDVTKGRRSINVECTET